MEKTKQNLKPVSVDIKGLMQILGAGKRTAERIGNEAGAAVRVGRRVLYNVAKIEQYMEEKAG